MCFWSLMVNFKAGRQSGAARCWIHWTRGWSGCIPWASMLLRATPRSVVEDGCIPRTPLGASTRAAVDSERASRNQVTDPRLSGLVLAGDPSRAGLAVAQRAAVHAEVPAVERDTEARPAELARLQRAAGPDAHEGPAPVQAAPRKGGRRGPILHEKPWSFKHPKHE